jgi:hypothetical protein
LCDIVFGLETLLICFSHFQVALSAVFCLVGFYAMWIGTSRWDKVTGEWRKLHNEELNYLYSLPNIVKNEMGGACGAYGGGERSAQGVGGET